MASICNYKVPLTGCFHGPGIRLCFLIKLRKTDVVTISIFSLDSNPLYSVLLAPLKRSPTLKSTAARADPHYILHFAVGLNLFRKRNLQISLTPFRSF